jgi:hypothetical protein
MQQRWMTHCVVPEACSEGRPAWVCVPWWAVGGCSEDVCPEPTQPGVDPSVSALSAKEPATTAEISDRRTAFMRGNVAPGRR